MKKRFWSEEEEKLFDKAWHSTAYDRSDLERIFNRTWNALNHKAAKLGFAPRWQIEHQAEVDAVRKALKEDHVI